MPPSNSSFTSRSAVPSGTLVRLIVATSCVWAMTRCGSSEWSGVSTLGAGPSASMQPAMKRIISASLIDSASASGARRASESRVKPSRPMVRRSVPLPFTSSASPTLIEVLPPPGWTRRVSAPRRWERWTRLSRGSGVVVMGEEDAGGRTTTRASAPPPSGVGINCAATPPATAEPSETGTAAGRAGARACHRAWQDGNAPHRVRCAPTR